MKNIKLILRLIILTIIQVIEKYELRKNISLDENDPLKKIINILPLNINTLSDNGIVPVSEINRTIPLQMYRLELENGDILDAADTHIVFCENYVEKFVKDLDNKDFIITKNGLSKVKKVKKIYGKISMFDFSIDSMESSYFTNNILSHNTITTSIYILWYVLFNTNKGVMIVANKSKTTKEILLKIKSIYKLLPFFLKDGIENWNESTVSFENGSRIQTEARSSEPAIGFTIDLLYLDEFAKVPDSIIRKYYGEVVPVVSSIDNSKIIISSTPDGFNLFWELITGAEKPEDDDQYNGFASKRIYWYQVKGRRDTIIVLKKSMLKKYKITKTYIKKFLKLNGYKFYDDVNNDGIIYINFFKDSKEEIPHPKATITDIRKILMDLPNGKKIPLGEISRISTWEEDQTKLIGGHSMFRQEYGLEFLTDDKTLFDTIKFQQITQNIKEYKHLEISQFSRRLPIPYTNLVFIDNEPDLFDINKLKEYYIFIGIDLAEGLGLDYSVINIFRLTPKENEWLKNNEDDINNIYDTFRLLQIGIWRSNIYKINEISYILYMLVFELFDSEKVRIIVEMNKKLGDILINSMPYVFDGNNNYGDFIFLRFKHRETDKFPKKGLLIGRDKKYMIKEFQDNVLKDNMVLTNESNIIELKSFAKKETPSGDVTYRSQSGHDDMVMSMVNLSAVYEHNIYKQFIENYIEDGFLTKEQQELILGYKNNDNVDTMNMVIKSHGNIYNNKQTVYNDILKTKSGNFKLGMKNIENWYKR
jgi:hypothetical protein